MTKSQSIWGKFQTAIKSFSSPDTDAKPIIIVSGLPRSGTSMMMKMLEAGGIPTLTDHIRSPDDDNPKGYYEFERVKKLDKGDTVWLDGAPGQTVKVISMLLKHLPDNYAYRVIFMERRLEETLASQKQMLIRRDQDSDAVADDTMLITFRKHLAQIKPWLDAQPNMMVLYVSYNAVMTNPIKQAAQINQFLGGHLDEAAMVKVVDSALYRQRNT